MLRHRSHLSDTAHRAQDHIEARFAGPLPLAEIASKCGVSERTLTRRFTQATGLTPLRYQQLLRPLMPQVFASCARRALASISELTAVTASDSPASSFPSSTRSSRSGAA